MGVSLDVYSEYSREKIKSIPLESSEGSKPIRLNDEDRIYFQVDLSFNCVPILYITDIALSPTELFQTHNGYSYRWRSLGDEKGRKPFFRNLLGECRFSLSVSQASDRLPETYTFSPVEIRGNKVSQQTMKMMVEYLGQNSPDFLWIPRAATTYPSLRSGKEQYDYLHFLDEAEMGVEVLKRAIAYLRLNACSRLTPKRVTSKTHLKPDYSSSNFDWLVSHPDVLVPVNHFCDESVTIHGKHYIPEELEIQSLDEDRDVYENRVVVGYIELILDYLRTFISKFDDSIAYKDEIEKYRRGRGLYLFQILKLEGIKYLASGVSRAKGYLSSLEVLYRSYLSVCCVSRSVKEPPVFTPKVLSDIYYRSIFERVASWHSLGTPNWKIAEPHAGLKSIDQIYELYCLARLKESIVESGFTMTGEVGDQDSMLFVDGSHYLKLEYERCFYSSRYKEASDVYNIENWYGYQGKLHRRKGTKKSHRKPDFTITLWDVHGLYKKSMIVFDAKYKDHRQSFLKDLAECTMRYVHGLSLPTGGVSPTKVFYLLCSGSDSNSYETQQFHAAEDGFDIYSSQPSIPCLGLVELSPHNRWDFDGFVKRAIEVGKAAIESDESLEVVG